ncbi:hypothetical protein Pla52o_19500 [Novipirellula galeiformis]|uniref:Uncharacterized protein n=2 Tax=Novipirellula galeiformis TaxID=2528004 RepID=A0A5C6CKD9_9BACT|nr:hypothetical protein Pla52o_19500 [Novipirellula galeiformis]
MSVRKLTASLLTTIAMLGAIATGYAQDHVPPADPLAFDPDFQWFRPVYDMDLADLKPKKRANTGWFATYDRLALYASRPELEKIQDAETEMDRGWGHRYEVGYMLPDVEHGWMFTYTNLGGPGKYDIVARERLIRFGVVADADDEEGDSGPLIPSDGNTPGYDQRLYFVANSLNAMEYDSFELNKTWRMEPYHYGGILEPLVGFRWAKLDDYVVNQDYRTTADGTALPDVFLGDDYEQLTTDSATTKNDILAAQFGFRYIKFRNRFTYTADFRGFVGGSLQSAMTQRQIDTTVGIDETPDFVTTSRTRPLFERNEQFVIGFDIRGELAYQLTRAIKIRTGFQVIDLATGIWRGGPVDPTGTNQERGGSQDQDVVMVGGTFGIELNR